MDPLSLADKLFVYGPLGIMLVAACWALYKKDEELKIERAARVTDAKEFTKLALELQSKAIDVVNKQADILEEMKRIHMSGPSPGNGRR